MKALALAVLFASPFVSVPASADVTPSAAPVKDDLSYDDAAMHFRAPDGWLRLPINPEAAATEGAPRVLYVLRSGRDARATITITIADFDGALGEFAATHAQSIRTDSSSGDVSAYIDKRIETKTSNGMPVVEMIWTLTPTGAIQVKNYEELFIDGQRSVIVKYSGHVGDIDDKSAAEVFSSLYAVGYPRARPTD